MINRKKQPFTFIIRASGEATVENLKSQLSRQISVNDVIITLDDEVSFEEKLRQGYEVAIEEDNPFTVFIDGDILLRRNAVKRIRNISKTLDDSDFGFGLKLWDRFYDQPKFRGLHIYQTKHLRRALGFIPMNGGQLRPESFVKNQMAIKGNHWKNNLSFYIAGIHDFYQKPQDIYYKFLVRSKRSKKDVQKLKSKFKSYHLNRDYQMALKGLEDGEKHHRVTNNKYEYFSEEMHIDQNSAVKVRDGIFIDFIVMKKLIEYYKFSSLFWKSI